jgi:hypothetical protein
MRPFSSNALKINQKQTSSLPLSLLLTIMGTCAKDTEWRVKKKENYRDITGRLSAVEGPLPKFELWSFVMILCIWRSRYIVNCFYGYAYEYTRTPVAINFGFGRG